MVSTGRHHRAIPGPSIMPERVLRAMHRAAPNIYEGELIPLAESLYRDLNGLAGNSGDVLIYIGNGHAAWEASLCNVLSRGDRVLALVTGRFGQGWAATAAALGIDVQTLDFGSRQAVDPSAVESALRADEEHQIRAVITVQTDTASAVRNDVAAIRQAMTDSGHPALLMVDSIASFACEALDMDAMGIDVMLSVSQKGLMTPPGLAFVFVRNTVWEHHERADLNTPYWNWKTRVEPAYFAARFCGTPPTHHLYGLREAVDILLEEGREQVWLRHERQAQAVWAAVEAWSAGTGQLSLNVPRESERSHVVTCIRTESELAAQLRHWCEQNGGLTLGIGLGLEATTRSSNDVFRIGHMGHLDAHALLGTLSVIEAGLHALGVKPSESGAAAAARIMAEVPHDIDPCRT